MNVETCDERSCMSVHLCRLFHFSIIATRRCSSILQYNLEAYSTIVPGTVQFFKLTVVRLPLGMMILLLPVVSRFQYLHARKPQTRERIMTYSTMSPSTCTLRSQLLFCRYLPVRNEI